MVKTAHTPADRQALTRLAWPMILSNLSVPLLGLVDAAVMGHLPDPRYLAGVALGSILFDFLYWSLAFLRMGTTGLAAQALGRNDTRRLRATLGQALLLGLALSVMLLALHAPIGVTIFSLTDGSPSAEAEAALYFAIRIWGAPAVLASYAILGWFLGAHNARAPLILLVSQNLLNVILDLWLVVGLGWNTAGVAWASVGAEYAGLALGVVLIRRELHRFPGRWPWPDILNIRELKKVLSVNASIFIRTLALIFAMAFFTNQGARQGNTILAANALLLHLHVLVAYGLDGFANAGEALVGRAVGARDRLAFERVVGSLVSWSAGIALAFAGIFLLAGPYLIATLTDIAEVRLAAETYLIWAVLLPLVSVGSYVLDGIFLGATRTREMRNSMLIAVLVVFLPAWYMLAGSGNHGLWLAFTLFMAARGATLALAYRKIQAARGFVATA